MNEDHSRMAAESVCFAAERVTNRMEEYISNMDRPSAIYKPRLSLDGNSWIAVLGENIQEGVVGVGDSPASAMNDFDNAWYKKQKPE